MPTTTFTTLATRLPVRTQCGNDATIWDWTADSTSTPTCPVCGYTDPSYKPLPTLLGGNYSPLAQTLRTEGFLLQYSHLKIAGTDRLSLMGTSEFVLSGFGAAPGDLILGQPKTPALSFVVPGEYVFSQFTRLSLAGSQRADLRGTADLVVFDDFSTRSRIVLAGRG